MTLKPTIPIIKPLLLSLTIYIALIFIGYIELYSYTTELFYPLFKSKFAMDFHDDDLKTTELIVVFGIPFVVQTVFIYCLYFAYYCLRLIRTQGKHSQ